MAFLRILAYNEDSGQYDIPVSDGDESAPATLALSKLKPMERQARFLVEKVGGDVYQARLSFLNNVSGHWMIAPDVDASAGTFAAGLSLLSFPAYIWLKASCPGGERLDRDDSVGLKAVANQDYVSLPSISSADNTRTASVVSYDPDDVTGCEARLSAWPDGEARKTKSVTVFVRAGGGGTLYICGKTASGLNEVQKSFAATPGTRTVTLDLVGPEPFTEVVLRSYSATAPTVGSYGTVSNVVILSDPNPAQDVFDLRRALLLIGDAEFDACVLQGILGLANAFDTEIVGYASTDYAADTRRLLQCEEAEALFESKRVMVRGGKTEFETSRVGGCIGGAVCDTLRQTKRTGELNSDTMRRGAGFFSGAFDTAVKTKGYYVQYADTVRQLAERPVQKNYFFIS